MPCKVSQSWRISLLTSFIPREGIKRGMGVRGILMEENLDILEIIPVPSSSGQISTCSPQLFCTFCVLCTSLYTDWCLVACSGLPPSHSSFLCFNFPSLSWLKSTSSSLHRDVSSFRPFSIFYTWEKKKKKKKKHKRKPSDFLQFNCCIFIYLFLLNLLQLSHFLQFLTYNVHLLY